MVSACKRQSLFTIDNRTQVDAIRKNQLEIHQTANSNFSNKLTIITVMYHDQIIVLPNGRFAVHALRTALGESQLNNE